VIVRVGDRTVEVLRPVAVVAVAAHPSEASSLLAAGADVVELPGERLEGPCAEVADAAEAAIAVLAGAGVLRTRHPVAVRRAVDLLDALESERRGEG
jgi:dihydropteroate synthase